MTLRHKSSVLSLSSYKEKSKLLSLNFFLNSSKFPSDIFSNWLFNSVSFKLKLNFLISHYGKTSN